MSKGELWKEVSKLKAQLKRVEAYHLGVKSGSGCLEKNDDETCKGKRALRSPALR